MKSYFKNIKDKQFLQSIFLMIGIQLITFMLVKLVQSNYHTFNFEIDNKIPFIPQLIILYNLYYPVIFILYYNMYNKDKETYYKGIIAGIIGYVIADIIFIIYPTLMIRPDITNISLDPINKLVLKLTYFFDSPALNCLPSMHCVFCFQAAYFIFRCDNYQKKYKVISIILPLLIAATTVFVKQHYLIDVGAAFIVVIISIILSNILYERKNRLS